MAKFLNKKEQVIDFKLTDYGHYLLSLGRLQPKYYAFFDDNILYDGQYAGSGSAQSNIQQRIQEETQYLETITVFDNIDASLLWYGGKATGQTRMEQDAEHRIDLWWESDVTATMREPDTVNLKFSSMIGDAALDGNTQHAPAWKVVALEGQISSSTHTDTKNKIHIPQINVDLNYVKKVVSEADTFAGQFPDTTMDALGFLGGFAGGGAIALVMDHPLVYCEEMNTQLFTENFDVEVFMIESGSMANGDKFIRKYFERFKPQIVDNLMVSATPQANDHNDLTVDSVEYYFDIYTDEQIGEAVACKAAEIFNKSSYYVDLDFECATSEDDEQFLNDIYGRVTESEICPT
jgi:hypothetical protein